MDAKKHPWLRVEVIAIIVTILCGLLGGTAGSIIWMYASFASPEDVQKAIKPLNERQDRFADYAKRIESNGNVTRESQVRMEGELKALTEFFLPHKRK